MSPAQILLVILAFAPAPEVGAEPLFPAVSLKDRFPKADRNQCRVGACHAFAALTLIEGLLGLEEPLSKADLFVRYTVKTGAYDLKDAGEELDVSLVEAGDTDEDLRFAVARGVAFERTASWEDFLGHYESFKRLRSAECEKAFQDAVEDLAERGALPRFDVKKCVRKEPAFKEFLDGLRRADPAEWAERENRLLGDEPRLEQERAELRRRLKGYSVRSFTFKTPAPKDERGPTCAAGGGLQRALMLGPLRSSLPVAIQVDIAGLPGWGHEAVEKTAYHAVVVSGFHWADDGSLVFDALNSWGDERSYSLGEDALCRIENVAYLEL